MKQLLLMRHAKSDWNHPGLADRERPLNQRGWLAAARMGQWLHEESLVPEMILVSPATRAQQTVDRLVEGLVPLTRASCDSNSRGLKGTGEPVANRWFSGGERETVSTLYPGSPQELLAAAGQIAPEVSRVLLVGHNPSMEVLVGSIGGQPIKFPTAAIAVVNVEAEHWRSALQCPSDFVARCSLFTVCRPKDFI